MRKTLVLVTLLAVAFAQTCDLSSKFTYQGQCLEKSCINDKLSRIKFIPLDPLIDTNIGQLSLGITYTAEAIMINNSTEYRVTILYGDKNDTQIVSDPTNCIDLRVYQNVNAFDVDFTRLYSTSEGSVPSWPLSTYQFNDSLSAGQITFNVTQAELDSRQCISFTYQDQTQWECFFELAFVIQNVTQASYYFSFTVTVNAALRAGNVPAVNFIKIIEVERCVGQSSCAVNVVVPTSLYFCKDSTCADISLTPYFLLYINRGFYMLHRIDDASFASTSFIQNVTLTFQSFNFQLSINESEFNVTQRVVGRNIYLVHVPIFASDVLITAFGILRQQGATIINETSIGVATIRTGQVLSAADQAAAIAALAAAQANAAAKVEARNQATIQAQIAAQTASDAIAQAAYNAKVQADAQAHAQQIAAAKDAAKASAKAAAEQQAAAQALAEAQSAAAQAAAKAAADQAVAQAATLAAQQAAAQAADQAATLAAQQTAAQAADQAATLAAQQAAAQAATLAAQQAAADQAAAQAAADQAAAQAAAQNATLAAQQAAAQSAAIANLISNSTMTPNSTLTPNSTMTSNSTMTPNSTLTPNSTMTSNSTMTPNSTLTPNSTMTSNSTMTPNSTLTPNSTMTSNITMTPNSTLTPNSTMTSNSTMTPNSTLTPNSTMTSNSTMSPNSTLTPNSTMTSNSTSTSVTAGQATGTSTGSAPNSTSGVDAGVANVSVPIPAPVNTSNITAGAANITAGVANIAAGNGTGSASGAVCDQVTSFTYQNQCVPKSCLINKLSRIMLTPLDQFTTNIGKLSLGIVYTASVVQSASAGYSYHVQILYGDQENNQLVSDPVNCIDFRVYQVANAYDIDNTRVGVSGDGSVPMFPVSNYTFNAQSSAGQIDFNITQADLDTHQCIRLAGIGQVQWECFFELAFIVKDVTQVSYYFSIIVVLNTSIDSISVPSVNFVKIVQIERCPGSNADGNVCQVQVNIASDLLFCQDATCAVFKNTPYYVLYLNRVFFMIHRIVDAGFNTSYYINNATLNYQAFGFQLNLQPSDYTELAHNLGYNIYELHVPIVAQQVLITASGVLSQTARRLLQDTTGTVPVTHTSVDLGQVPAAPNTSTSEQAPATNNDNNNNALLLGSGLALLVVIGL